MYSEKIKTKVDTIFDELCKKINTAIKNSSTSKEAIEKVTHIVSSELSTRSKSILSDMLFDLSDKLMETDFFNDISRQNRFSEINLRQEILNKYCFEVSTSINYEEPSRELDALKTAGITFAAGGVIEVGAILIKGLSLSKLVPIPIFALIAVSIGVALAEYFKFGPAKSKRDMMNAINDYLVKTKTQFLQWFDEVEIYFNGRVQEIQETI